MTLGVNLLFSREGNSILTESDNYRVTGRIDHYYGLTQIIDPTLIKMKSSSRTIEPVKLNIEDSNLEEFENWALLKTGS